jgi:hypothetical protein
VRKRVVRGFPDALEFIKIRDLKIRREKDGAILEMLEPQLRVFIS